MTVERLSARRLCGAVVVSLVAAFAMLAAGCGGTDVEQTALTAAQVEAFSTPYCGTARNWAAHMLDGDGDNADTPAALEAYWKDYLGYRTTSLEQAPPSLRDENAALVKFLRTRLTPVLEKYDFDVDRIAAEGTPAEKSLDTPPPRVQKAQDSAHAYDDRFCGYGGSPPPAKVTFRKSAASNAYCDAAAAQEQGFGPVVASKWAPAAFRKYVTSSSFQQALDRQDATAPPEIAADVKADNDWVRTRKLPLLADYGYDLRRLMREGTAEELAVFNYFDPAIEKQDSRVEAYVQQVCGAS